MGLRMVSVVSIATLVVVWPLVSVIYSRTDTEHFENLDIVSEKIILIFFI